MTNNAKSDTVAILFECYPSSAFYPIAGGSMYKVNLWAFYELAWEIHPLTEIKPSITTNDLSHLVFEAKLSLDIFFQRWESPLEICKTEVLQLRKWFDYIEKEVIKNPDEFAHRVLIDRTIHLAKQFENSLRKQFEFLDTYYVQRKGAYDTTALIDRADDVILSDKIKTRLPEQTIYDLQQAGKCIAFEIPNSAGFHTIRAVESVIRLYYEKIIGVLPKNKDRNWGAYIKNLKTAGANEKILHALDHLRNDYRNPILHPEERLEFDDAFSLFNLSVSLIIKMTKEIIALENAATKS